MTAVTASPAVAVVGAAAVGAMVGDLEKVAVLDGIDPQQAYAARSITIGGTWDPDIQHLSTDDVVTVETTEAGGGRRLVETTAIDCIAYSGGEGLALADHRARVNDMLAALRAALRGVAEVEGASASARIADQRWAQVADEQGAGIICLFTVAVVVLP